MRVVAIVRRELRLHDNPLWQHAGGHEVIPLFVLDPFNQEEHGEPLRTLFFFALKQLSQQISQRGGHLYVIAPDQQEAFFALAKPDLVLFCEDHEPHLRQRDATLVRLLQRLGIRYQALQGSTLSPMPKEPFKTFTQFYKRHFMPNMANADPTPYPTPHHFRTPRLPFPEVTLPQPQSNAAKLWLATEEEVQRRWQKYVREHLSTYEQTRNFLTEEASSRMSPYIRCGLISLQQLWRDAKEISEAYVRELAWHDFYAHLLHFFPETVNTEWRPEWRGFPWRHDEQKFEKWCSGQTGIPLVDAAMRQLNEEGWLPNRVRMVVASFLTKHLQIDWRWGERYFYRHLVDADLAQNLGNWQWTAGCGADAAPYFRIFNPLLQGQKFDPNGDYIRRYVPELRHVPAERLHQPEPLTTVVPDYPPLMVDLTAAAQSFQEIAQTHLKRSNRED